MENDLDGIGDSYTWCGYYDACAIIHHVFTVRISLRKWTASKASMVKLNVDRNAEFHKTYVEGNASNASQKMQVTSLTLKNRDWADRIELVSNKTK